MVSLEKITGSHQLDTSQTKVWGVGKLPSCQTDNYFDHVISTRKQTAFTADGLVEEVENADMKSPKIRLSTTTNIYLRAMLYLCSIIIRGRVQGVEIAM